MKNKKILITVILISVFIVLAFLLPQFNQNKTDDIAYINDQKGYLYTETPYDEVSITYAYDVTNNLSKLVNESDAIIVGRIFNLTGNKHIDATYEEPLNYSEKLTYLETEYSCNEFVVIDILKGEISDRSIFVGMKESDIFEYGEYKLHVLNPWYRNFTVNDYLLFLKKGNNGFYILESDPAAIEIVDHKIYIKESVISKSGNVFYNKLILDHRQSNRIIKINYNLPQKSSISFDDSLNNLTDKIKNIIKDGK